VTEKTKCYILKTGHLICISNAMTNNDTITNYNAMTDYDTIKNYMQYYVFLWKNFMLLRTYENCNRFLDEKFISNQ